MDKKFYDIDEIIGVTVVAFTWENIAWKEVEELKKVFGELLGNGKKNFVLDFSNVTYVSSVVLASLVYLLKKTKEVDGNMVICALQKKVDEVIRLTDLDKIFEIYKTKQEALERFG